MEGEHLVCEGHFAIQDCKASAFWKSAAIILQSGHIPKTLFGSDVQNALFTVVGDTITRMPFKSEVRGVGVTSRHFFVVTKDCDVMFGKSLSALVPLHLKQKSRVISEVFSSACGIAFATDDFLFVATVDSETGEYSRGMYSANGFHSMGWNEKQQMWVVLMNPNGNFPTIMFINRDGEPTRVRVNERGHVKRIDKYGLLHTSVGVYEGVPVAVKL